MGEGAVIAILANARTTRVTLTKFGLVHFRVVKLFHCIVRVGAGVTQGTKILF